MHEGMRLNTSLLRPRPLSSLDGPRRRLLVGGIKLGDDRSSRIGWRTSLYAVSPRERNRAWTFTIEGIVFAS